MQLRVLAACFCLLAFSIARASAQVAPAAPDLTAISIEELMSIDVTSASKREEPLFQVPAAIYVITQEELRHSLSIPEALRLVPGLDVAQIDANKWAVSARGFTGRFANKLLVLIDGRIVYTSTFSGVYWDTVNVVLEDVERIEVIRGPGAVLWGANAVNGVISIITKNSRDTQGGLVVAGAGNLATGFGEVRYGGDAGKGLTYRLFGEGQSRADNVLIDGSPGADAWKSWLAGMRADWQAGSDAATLEGSFYRGRSGERDTQIDSVQDPTPVLVERTNTFEGGSVNLGWTHRFSERSTLTLTGSYDDRLRDEVVDRQHEEVLDFELQQNFALGARQQIVSGIEYRRTTSHLEGTFQVSFDPQESTRNLVSGFIQDDLTVVESRFHVIAGIKIESYSGLPPLYQPNVRLLWTPDARQTVWASVARAYRIPSRAETGVRVNVAGFPGQDGTPVLVSLFGTPDLLPERLIAYEAGYRVQPSTSLSLDLAAFYNDYDDLTSVVGGVPFPENDPSPPHIVVPEHIANGGNGTTYGAELSANWNVMAWWRLRGAFTWLEMKIQDTNADGSVDALKADSPRFQANLRSSFDLPHDLGLDLNVFYVDRNPNGTSDAYTRVDLMANWQPRPTLRLSVGVINLTDARYLQASASNDGLQATVTPRSIYGKVTWRF